MPRTRPSKVPFIRDILHETPHLFFALTETWLRDQHDGETFIEGYTLLRSDRKNHRRKGIRDSGGAAIYINSQDMLDTETILNFSNGVVEAIGVHIKTRNVVVIVVYRQPDDMKQKIRSNSHAFRSFLSELDQALKDLPTPSPDILLCGDFNLPHAIWSDETCSGATSDERIMIEDLKKLVNEHLLIQKIDGPTHRDGNLLDLLFTNNADYIHSFSSNITVLSDHFLIECKTCFKEHYSPGPKPKTDAVDKDKETTFYDLNFFSEDVSWDALKHELSQTNWRQLFHKCSPSEMMEAFLSLCLDISKKHVPLKRPTSTTNRSKTIPRHRTKLMRARRRIQKQSVATHSEARKQALRKRLIEIEKKLQSSHSTEKEMEERKAVERINSNSKYFFSYAKRFSTIKVGIGPLLDAARAIVSCPFKMGEILSDQYASVFSKPMFQNSELENLFKENTLHTRSGLTDIDFNEDDILQAMNEFARNSAAGPDGFPALLLKECSSLSHPLFLIWRKSMTLGVVPASCKIANIIPIHKGKSRSAAKNYRPVALTSLIIKTYEKVIRRKLVNYLNENNMFNDSQHGFRGSRSCLSQLLSHFDQITRLLEAGKAVDVIYLDFAKAFDKVDIGITLHKLESLGIKGSLGRWLQSFLTGRSQCVLVEGVKSSPRRVLSGVPQGSVLGPLLFLILIGDIDENVAKSFISSFADDTRIGHGVTTSQDMEELQADLEVVYRWAVDNNMEFNSDKFEHIRYKSSKFLNLTEKNYYSNIGTPIIQKSNLRDLGVTISDDGTFSKYIDEKINKMKSKIGWVLRTFRTRECRPMLTLWKSLILSDHDYCSQLWNPQRIGYIQVLEQVQFAFLKKIHSVSHLNYWEQLSTLGLYSLQRRRERYIAIYTWKILEGHAPNIASGEAALSAKWHPRRGRVCDVPKVSGAASVRIQSIRRASFAVNGPRIFNSLPKHIRDNTNCDVNTFKSRLDKFLSRIPDQPLIPGYTAYRLCDTNSILDWLGNAQLRLDESSRQNDVQDLAAAIQGDHGH